MSRNEPVGRLAGKADKVVPHIPFYKQAGCVVDGYWLSEFSDAAGNRATLRHVKYRDKKGVVHEAVIQVKWH